MTTGNETAKSPPPEGAGAAPSSPPPSGGGAAPSSRPPPSRKSDRPSMRPGGPDSLLGHTLSGRYRIERVIGEGGMGVVYAAEHLHMRKRLAVKILHPEMSRLPEVVERFGREAMAAAHIDHPNVAAATDFGKLEDGSFFLVLEYIEGESLREVIGRGRIELSRALHIMEQIAAALGRANAIGIVHRDLKPENVMLILKDGDPDFVKVLDFGIAKVPVAELSVSEAVHHPAQPVLTQLGMVYGTPEYMAPEQALGQAVDARADLYALGIITYEMLTGLRPFDHESKVTLLGMQVTAPVPAMATIAPDAHVPAEVEAVVHKLLAKEASARFADARELIDATAAAYPALLTSPFSLRRSSVGSRTSLAGAAHSSPDVLPSAAKEASGPSGLERVRSELARVPARTWAIAGASVGAVAFLVLFVAVLSGGTAAHTAAAEGGATAAPADGRDAGTQASASAVADREIAAARQALTEGDAPGALKRLVPVEQAFPDRADVHRLMEQAYAHEHDTRNLLEEARRWVSLDPKGASDPELVEAVRAAAVGKEDPDGALSLLVGPMGSPGVDVLYDLAYGKTQGTVATRARQALASAEVRSHASDAALVALDLHAATSCEAKRAVLGRARESGDARATALLTPLTYTSGCGFLRSRDCWSCLHRDGALKEAIAAIAARGNAPPP